MCSEHLSLISFLHLTLISPSLCCLCFELCGLACVHSPMDLRWVPVAQGVSVIRQCISTYIELVSEPHSIYLQVLLAPVGIVWGPWVRRSYPSLIFMLILYDLDKSRMKKQVIIHQYHHHHLFCSSI